MCISPVWGKPVPETGGLLPKVAAVAVAGVDGDRLKEGLRQGSVRVRIVTEAVPELGPDPHADRRPSGHRRGRLRPLQRSRRLPAERRGDLRRGVRLAFWSGHSHGRYAGSTWYADAFGLDLARNCVAQVNCDSPGCRWATTFNELTATSETEPFVDAVIHQTTGLAPQTERPPRAGDYSFNGIGISSFYMLSSTMSPEARAEKGSYPVGGCGGNIAWHTEEDTLEIADRDNLLRDMRVYAASVLRVLNAPLLPFDWRRTTTEFAATLDRYQRAVGDGFDFAPARSAVQALDEALDRYYGQAPAHAEAGSPAAKRFNRVQRRLARLLVPVNYSRTTPFYHDPAMEVPPLPDLAPALSMPQVIDDIAGRGILTAHLMRGQNRLVWTLEQARELVEAATA